jgi:integrase
MKAHDSWQSLATKIRMLRERHDLAKAITPEQEHALLRATADADSACHTATVLALSTAMRKNEIRLLRWGQVDFDKRSLVVGHSKTDAGTGRIIPLNADAFSALIRWAGRSPAVRSEHYVFPWCEHRQADPLRPTKGWRTAWRHALKSAGFHCRFHDLRHTCITKLAESQASDMTIMAIAGHVSKKMLERYCHIRMAAKRSALDSIVQGPDRVAFGDVVHQNVHQLQESILCDSAKPLN